MAFDIIELTGMSLPETGELKRRHVRKGKRMTQHYLERYDRHTLFYDVFYRADTSELVFTAPRFLNLWRLLRKHLLIDGRLYKGHIKRMTWQRCDQAIIRIPKPQSVAIQHPEFQSTLEPRTSSSHLFQNLNVLYAMNKNNDLEWIKNWGQFHVNAHRLEGLVVIDNGSTDYDAGAILETLKNINGLKAGAVVKSPYPYGPVDSSGKIAISPRFLQTSMMNLMKQDLFYNARAILSVDIDELVYSPVRQNIFDATVSSFLGACSFREIKTYPSASEEKAYGHRQHTFTKTHGKLGNTKWCVSGSGFMNHFGWAVHRFGGGFFPLTETKQFRYLHCQATSTSWKKNRYKKVQDIEENTDVAKVLAQFLD